MTDDPRTPGRGRANADRATDLMTWQCVFALFQNELAHATAEALAQGTPAGPLAEQIEDRITRLRGQIGTADQDVLP